jgi:hypothetical protein
MAMNEPLKQFRKLLKFFNKRRVIGITFRDAGTFYAAEAENYSDSEIFGKRKILLNYHVSNQPCAMVKWTSQTQLFKYIQRKDKENYGK